MTDYSDIIYLMAAMLLFSLMSTNISKSFLAASESMVTAGTENRSIALAQDEIEQVKLLSRDKEDYLKEGNSDYMFADYPKNKTNIYGSDNQYEETFRVEATSELIQEPDPLLNRYLVTVTVTNTVKDYKSEATLLFIKSFEK